MLSAPAPSSLTKIISPGCRRSKVRVAKLYLGVPKAHWPTPKMDLNAEMQRYEAEFGKMGKSFGDIDFAVNKLLTKKEEAIQIKDSLQDMDGVLLIHLSMGMREWLPEILAAKRPTMLFAAPYSGHEWSQFGALMKEAKGENLDCILSSDRRQLAEAVRPFRAIHHLREAKVLNVTARDPEKERLKGIADKFGTEVKHIDLKRMLDTYESIDQAAAEEEAHRWIRGAVKVVEPPREEIVKSCRLALAFEKLMAEEQATVIMADCYGTMYRKLPAFPCVGHVRLNGLGLGGICESDLTSAMTFIMLQGLSGRPGFISDPTVDESNRTIILAHCLGSLKMDGPEGPAAPYKLRTIMERQEGCVPQVRMRVGQKVTQAFLVSNDKVLYFTGTIVEAPDLDRGCRTKIAVKVDGDLQKLWLNWSHGLHRLTCYGDVTTDLKRFCRFKGLQLVNEAA
jgi:L-fucose isomerase-like protein